jgi:hypothetical protein
MTKVTEQALPEWTVMITPISAVFFILPPVGASPDVHPLRLLYQVVAEIGMRYG